MVQISVGLPPTLDFDKVAKLLFPIPDFTEDLQATIAAIPIVFPIFVDIKR
jgi:hypothetical protein